MIFKSVRVVNMAFRTSIIYKTFKGSCNENSFVY